MTPDRLRAEGWTASGDFPGFSGHLAPFWHRMDGDALTLGLIVAAKQCNEHIHTLHGGAAMTFADIAGGSLCAQVLGNQFTATVQLQCQFTAVAREGEFISCTPELVRRTKDLLFVRGVMRTAERAVLVFDGIWKVLTPR